MPEGRNGDRIWTHLRADRGRDVGGGVQRHDDARQGSFRGNGTARWGDYEAAAVDGDGSIWMATEYTPDINRTSFANWSTYITRYAP